MNVSAARPIQKFAWLIFILAKQKVLNGGSDFAELAFLLYACLYWILILSPSDIQCDLIERKYKSQKSKQSRCLGFRESNDGKVQTLEERRAALDEEVRAYLTQALYAQNSSAQIECMIKYLEEMLLKVIKCPY